MSRWLSLAAAASVAALALAIPTYLAWQAMPLLTDSAVLPGEQGVTRSGTTLALFFEPGGDHALQVVRSGELQVMRPGGDRAAWPETIDVAGRLGGTALTAATAFTDRPERIVVGGRNGRILLLRWAEAGLEPDPLLPASLRLVADVPVTRLAAARTGEQAVVAALDDRNGLYLVRIARSGVQYLRRARGAEVDGCEPLGVELSVEARWLYLPCVDGSVRVIRIGTQAWTVEREIALDTPALTAHAMLADGQSLVVAAADGRMLRVFPVAAPGAAPRFATALAVAADKGGQVEALAAAHDVAVLAARRADRSISLHALPQRPLVARVQPADDTVAMALAGRRLLALDADGAYSTWLRAQAEPIPSLPSLWAPLHYAGESGGVYRWRPQAMQPATAGYSLTPLAFGTIKAALAGLLLAMPAALVAAAVAIGGMRPIARRRLDTTMTTLEYMPTVVLGLLAALWVAPALQAHLGAVLLGLALLAPLLLLAGWLGRRCGLVQVAAGWRNASATALILGAAWLAWYGGQLLEAELFGGSLSAWLEHRLGWRYEFGNALVAGVAIGVAVTPTLYPAVADAFTAVPREHYRASLALGATPGQTWARLLLPRALPGLAAAGLLGFARAVAETTIVLVALAATPVLAPSLLRGLQAIGPTLATGVPEAMPGGNGFRVLMAAALFLFLFTVMARLLAVTLRRGMSRVMT